jgi:iron complex transport system ATP-binding protein
VTVELQEVVVTYDRRAMVGPVTWRVESGGWLCLIGPNGAGKTSLLHAVAGVVPHQGRIRLQGTPTDVLSPRRRAQLAALVSQRPTIPPDMSVRDFVLLGRTPHISYFGTETRRDRAIAAAAVARLELEAFALRPLATLSGGELQRVLLARALAQQAPVLLLDEPTSALDLGHQQQVLHLVNELRRDYGLTVVSTMHDLTLAGSHADALVLLHDGHPVAEGSASEVLTEATLCRYYGADIEILKARDGTIAVVPLSRNVVLSSRAASRSGTA